MSKPVADVTIVLTCHNEGEMIATNLKEIRKQVKLLDRTFSYVLVDDGSTDGSVEILKGLEADDVSLIQISPNRGRGFAVSQGIRSAQSKFVGFIDPDLEIPLMSLWPCLNCLENGADIATVTRIYKFRLRDPIRYVLSVGYDYIVDSMLSTGGIDTEAGCKFFNRESILSILDEVEDERWFWDTEVIVRSTRAGLRIETVPVAMVRNPEHPTSVRIVRDTLRYCRSLVGLWRKLP